MSTPSEPVQPAPAGPTTPGTQAGGAGGPGGPGRPAAPATRPAAPQPKGPGVVKRTADNVKRILLVLIGALIALFAVLNRQDVEVDWIFGTPAQTPLILVIAIAFAAGAAIGWIVAKLGRRHSAGRAAADGR